MKMMDNDTGPVPRRYSDAGSVERLVGVRASRYASGRPGLRRAGENRRFAARQSHFENFPTFEIQRSTFLFTSPNYFDWTEFFAVVLWQLLAG